MQTGASSYYNENKEKKKLKKLEIIFMINVIIISYICKTL